MSRVTAMSTWVALLRGINVGGSNRLAMADLRATLGDLGAAAVSTHLQSGNAVFDHDEVDEATLARLVRTAIAQRHGLDVAVVLRSAAEMEHVEHPDADGGIDPKFLHILFFDRRPDPAGIAMIDAGRYAPDRFEVVGRQAAVTYPAGSGRSKLTIDVFERSLGVTATGRNLNTVRRLVELVSKKS